MSHFTFTRITMDDGNGHLSDSSSESEENVTSEPRETREPLLPAVREGVQEAHLCGMWVFEGLCLQRTIQLLVSRRLAKLPPCWHKLEKGVSGRSTSGTGECPTLYFCVSKFLKTLFKGALSLHSVNKTVRSGRVYVAG